LGFVYEIPQKFPKKKVCPKTNFVVELGGFEPPSC